MTSDTHDNGREEQWRTIGETAIEVVEENEFHVAVISVNGLRHEDAARLRDAILAARAQAGLDNHHNAYACPYCRPHLETERAQAGLAQEMREKGDRHADQYKVRAEQAEADRDEAVGLLRRLEQWDHMQSAGDGPYWLREIAKVLGESEPYPTRLARLPSATEGS